MARRADRGNRGRTRGPVGPVSPASAPGPLRLPSPPVGRVWDRYLWGESLGPGAARSPGRGTRRRSSHGTRNHPPVRWYRFRGHVVVGEATGLDIRPLTFDYFGRPRREHEAVLALTSRIGTGPLRRVDLPFLKEVDDLRKEGFENRRLLDSPEGYIPGRNLIFYGLAGHYAELDGVRYIVGGHNGIDPESFPDASPKFFNFLNSVFHLSLWSFDASPVQILVPLSGKSKEDVVRLGLELKVPFEVTWSCYWDRDIHCGTCVSCRERREAFAKVGIDDPVEYST